MKRIVVLSGAGISAESGLSTFRGYDGLWEGHRIEDVATPQAWLKNKSLVLDFYNKRREQAWNAQPNFGHLGLVELEKYFEVRIITQNVDDLHEKAGSTNILHLHGELKKSRSTFDPRLVYEQKTPFLNIGDKCELGSQLRPHIVWFGERVPLIEHAIKECSKTDFLVVIGTSMLVYPAANLVEHVPDTCEIFFINPQKVNLPELSSKLTYIQKSASEGVKDLVEILKSRI